MDTSTLRDVTEDICPAGWRLPTSADGGEFQTLFNAYSSNTTNFQTALNTPLSGNFYSGEAHYQGSAGYFWSSTWSTTSNMQRLYLGTTFTIPSNGTPRYRGQSVRCILSI